MSDHVLPSTGVRNFLLLLHFASSDVSRFALIYSRQMRQEYLQELYPALSVLQQSAGVCLCQPCRGCPEHSPLPVKPITILHCTAAAGPCPWVWQIKPQPSTGRLPTSAPVPGQGWAPGSWGCSCQCTGPQGVTRWHISFPLSLTPLVAPSKLFWCQGGTSAGPPCAPPPSKPCWNAAGIADGVTEGKSHLHELR